MSVSRVYSIFKRGVKTICKNQTASNIKFDHVFSFPSIGYFALLNRLKLYHFFGSCIAIPSVGIMEMLSALPPSTVFGAAYIGITGGVVLSVATLPFRNIIGHIYISEDNELIKISSVDYFGKRVDRLIKAEEWVPLLEMKPKTSDAFYLSPQLTDGTKYKLLVRYGTIKDARKIGQVLE